MNTSLLYYYKRYYPVWTVSTIVGALVSVVHIFYPLNTSPVIMTAAMVVFGVGSGYAVLAAWYHAIMRYPVIRFEAITWISLSVANLLSAVAMVFTVLDWHRSLFVMLLPVVSGLLQAGALGWIVKGVWLRKS